MLTGDDRRTAAAIAREADVDRVLAEILPEDKAREIVRLRESAAGSRWWVTASTTRRAGAGRRRIAMGSAPTSHRGRRRDADARRPVGRRGAVDLSRRTIRIVKENLVWAFGYNVVLIPVRRDCCTRSGGVALADPRRRRHGIFLRVRRNK